MDHRSEPAADAPTAQRRVFVVSDGTGITAETLAHTLLTQFDGLAFSHTTLPFIDSVDKARATVEYINHVAATDGARPLVFSTTVADPIRNTLRGVHGLFIDLFDVMIPSLERELARGSTHAQGRAHGVADPGRYSERIAAMNFAMEHDDGASTRDLQRAEVILIAPSRCGKTPTALYLALQYSVFACNFPLTEEELAECALPQSLRGLLPKLFGLMSEPERLAQVRGERRPGSRYASLEQCAWELRQAEALYRRLNLPFVVSANKSIEEIAARVLQVTGLRRT
ncbi:MAG: kinase/pyrophosphorylase [Gammaproteobacteria bacterium]|nr:kinase/pyrophosphorylase [Gammaproteobacteria bacterium]